ncbi:MAG: prepilin-type N-terminal cleavage/methylation domain-containing protein [Armatimonadota bacterium]|nr:prepilin-type N-terminal cleavage/methylation domain-containing protein [Armatimonadota bacterium]MDW8142444.1 prepilin-type N-terminal cleavage/methylation domain-containing protein [Armatimonadota bacterium]
MFLWQSQTTHRSPRVRKGFTLVELVVAFLILVIGVTAILELVSQSALNARYAKDKTTATVLAQQKLEELLSQSDLTTGEFDGDFGDAYPQFRWRAQINEVSNSASETGTSLLQIIVTVEWTDRGQIRSVQLETLQASVPLLHPQEASTQQQSAGTFSDFSASGFPTGGGRQ